MTNQYHILNGDALKDRFPSDLSGQLIVARECLVDGPVKAQSLEDLYRVRATFVAEAYGDISETEYRQKTVTEFEKIQAITNGSTVNLWFEDDLFCQVNCWFVAHLLYHFAQNVDVYLVRPPKHTEYGFAAYDAAELKQLFHQRQSIKDLSSWSLLWKHYQQENKEQLLKQATVMEARFPFILTAVLAHLERQPSENSLGRPAETLLTIVDEMGTRAFGPVFQEFNRRESIYGFGDLQVKWIFDEVLAGR
jgi:hypothetical protein